MSIFLIRHAQSEANYDEVIYESKPDHDISLTEKGHEQAHELGRFMKEYFSINPPQGKVRLWTSPYKRTVQTMNDMKAEMGEGWTWDVDGRGLDVQYDDRLRERDWGVLHGNDIYGEHSPMEAAYPHPVRRYRLTRAAALGKYYARPFGGESIADVTMRLHSFFHDLHFDIRNGVKDHVIVMHGLSMLAFALAFTKTHPAYYEKELLPGNTAVRVLDLDPQTQRFMDYGIVYDPEKNIRITEKPAQPLRRKYPEGL